MGRCTAAAAALPMAWRHKMQCPRAPSYHGTKWPCPPAHPAPSHCSAIKQQLPALLRYTRTYLPATSYCSAIRHISQPHPIAVRQAVPVSHLQLRYTRGYQPMTSSSSIIVVRRKPITNISALSSSSILLRPNKEGGKLLAACSE